MRSRPIRIAALVLAGTLLLGGCLVSEEPVLDASNGRARPLQSGDYVSCPVEEDADGAPDCSAMHVSRDAGGLYTITTDDEETIEWRFRRVGRGGYALQSAEGNDGYAYYYARTRASGLRLTLMQCPSLPEKLRTRLINRRDLETDDDFKTCVVLTLRGLVDAAKAYHNGAAEDEEELAIMITPAPAAKDAFEE